MAATAATMNTSCTAHYVDGCVIQHVLHPCSQAQLTFQQGAGE
jgi:hypothetical protein